MHNATQVGLNYINKWMTAIWAVVSTVTSQQEASRLKKG